VSVWKDSRALGRVAAEVSLALAAGGAPAQIVGATRFTSPGGVAVPARLLDPVPITRANLDVVIDAGWATRDAVCRGVSPGPDAPPACRAN
jgi:D-xylose transport system substrate-binding protein